LQANGTSSSNAKGYPFRYLFQISTEADTATMLAMLPAPVRCPVTAASEVDLVSLPATMRHGRRGGARVGGGKDSREMFT
jgi:hypothetical protein